MARIIYSGIIPFEGFKCVNLFGVLFVRKGETMTDADLNHEAIHTAQMRELLYVFFYIVYFFEWLVRLFIDWSTAYRSISFEREAYENQDNPNYLHARRHFEQWRK